MYLIIPGVRSCAYYLILDCNPCSTSILSTHPELNIQRTSLFDPNCSVFFSEHIKSSFRHTALFSHQTSMSNLKVK